MPLVYLFERRFLQDFQSKQLRFRILIELIRG